MNPKLFLLLTSAAALAAGCSLAEVVRERGASDMRCPPDDVQVLQLPGHAWRASGCGSFATYVCHGDLCVMNGPRSDDAPTHAPVPATPPPAAPVAETSGSADDATPTDAETKPQTVVKQGVAFDLPASWARDTEAKGEVYRDKKRHHAARLTVTPSKESAPGWLTSHYPEAKTWIAKLSGTEVAFATQLGKTLRLSFAAIANEGKVHELACSSDDLSTEKTDSVCASVLKSFRLKVEEGLPGE